jgi:hypothetical protein
MESTAQMRDQERGDLTTADPASAGDKASGPTAVQEAQTPSGPSLAPQPADEPTAPASLFPTEDAESLRKGWGDVQAGFVDDPRRAVEQADSLVAGVIKRLTDSFAGERSKLEGQWSRGEDVSTEDLRLALQRYRSLLDRLLSL